MYNFITQKVSKTYNLQGFPRICVIDCGLKYNQLRCFLKRNARVDVIPWDYDFTKDEFDGLFISNGPGDPRLCKVTIAYLRKYLSSSNPKPIFGICLGHQLLSLAAGCHSYKMKYVYFTH